MKITLTDIKIIGLGGIGDPVAKYMGMYLYGKNTDTNLVLVDGDKYESSNKERMAFFKFGEKALVKEMELTRLYGDRVNIRALPLYVNRDNIHEIIREKDLVFLAVDNHKTRKLVNEYCKRMRDIVLISGGNDGVEKEKPGTFGNVQMYWRKRGVDKTNNLTAFHPEILDADDINPGDNREVSCSALINSVPQLAFTNLAVASAMLNLFSSFMIGQLKFEEVYLDVKEFKMNAISRAVVK
ncbi:ThiF family adenylyltransferase [candidate division KSB1 bacterium]|nr:ThiF family adenylyltransferase [candidate division KSB1 bacterium]